MTRSPVGGVALRLRLPAEQALCGWAIHQRTRTRRTPPSHPPIQPSLFASPGWLGHDRPAPRTPEPRAPRRAARLNFNMSKNPGAHMVPVGGAPADAPPEGASSRDDPATFAHPSSYVNIKYTYQNKAAGPRWFFCVGRAFPPAGSNSGLSPRRPPPALMFKRSTWSAPQTRCAVRLRHQTVTGFVWRGGAGCVKLRRVGAVKVWRHFSAGRWAAGPRYIYAHEPLFSKPG